MAGHSKWANIKPGTSEIQQRAAVAAPVPGDDVGKMLKLSEALEEVGDVQSVHSSTGTPDELFRAAG